MTTEKQYFSGPDVETMQKQVLRWVKDQWPNDEVEVARMGEYIKVGSYEFTVKEMPNGKVEVEAPTIDTIATDLFDHLSGGSRAQEQGAAHVTSDDGQEGTVVKPFGHEHAVYMEEGDDGFDPSHERCRSCAHYDDNGNCRLVPNIDPDGYCEEFYADIGFYGHEHEGFAELNLTVIGEDFDWEERDAEDFLDRIAEKFNEVL